MITIPKKVENAVVSVLSSQASLSDVETIRGREAVEHATYPRIVVKCKDVKSMIPGMVSPYKAKLEMKVETESKLDITSDTCEDIADSVYTELAPPQGKEKVNQVASGFKLDNIDITSVFGPNKTNDVFEVKIISEIILQSSN